jgi:hypothetical protein
MLFMKLISGTITAVFLFAVVLATGCYYDKEDLLYGNTTVDCTSVDSKYSTAIAPLMQSKCSYSGCHDAGSSAGGLVLENHTQVAASAGSINQRCIIERNMPPGTPLTSTEYTALQCWLQAGAPNN